MTYFLEDMGICEHSHTITHSHALNAKAEILEALFQTHEELQAAQGRASQREGKEGVD